ncbi:hypothetical protein MNBD_GAMMA11-2884 [hydrothermal vent metagenome]|uniref:Probable pectate lyase C n=1 Tax=hydrothermal vent metagenome TaxID=652676 RepID=A0A3B0X4Y6_9ZZZZ
MLRKISLSFFLLLSSANAMAQCDVTLPAQGNRDDVLIIVNDNSLDSCEVGRYYAEQRGLGQNNILHVRTPANYYIQLDQFKILRDQIIQHMQQRIVARDSTFIPVVCTDGDIPFYCQASMDQLRANTGLRYIVTTKGVPTRFIFNGSTIFLSPNSSTSVDNYLKYWLINYFTKDISFSSISQNRARAFGDGRNIRIVEPASDLELVIGRIDGVTLDTAKALIDRTHAAEGNGFYGKIYAYTGLGSPRFNGPIGMRWKDYSQRSANIYDGSGAPWRYPFGIFGEAAPECSDYLDPTHYLNFSQSDSRGKAPQSCTLKFSVGLNGANDQPPGQPSSRQPLADDAIIYSGYLDGQAAGNGSFNAFLNWRRDSSCTNTLCEDLPATEQAACRAASIDVYKEIDTRCVGMADGFIGYNYQSFPVAQLQIAPTGWLTGTSGGYRIGRPVVREDSGFDDNLSLWYQDDEEVASPACYSSSDFSAPASADCVSDLLMNFNQKITFATTQTSDALAPDQYRLRLKYNAENLNKAITVKAFIQVTELVGGKRVNYNRVNVSLAIPANTVTGWQDGEAIINFDHSDSEHSVDWDGTYNTISLFLVSSNRYRGALGIDNVSLEKLDPAGIADPVPVALVNPSFDQGHKQTTTGDHAANYLSRLNGVGFWGSLSHHESNGHSFSRHTLESLTYFMRGLPLGDAVWFAENNNSGIFYGDPLYSPVAIKLADINLPFDFIFGDITLQGDTVNGRDLSVVSTSYQVDFCPGNDFFICDRQGTWQSTGLNGTGGAQGTDLGVWSTAGQGTGAHTIRLGVTSTNQATGRSQTYYDYYPVVLADQTSDFDADGVLDVDELSGGMDPTNTDSDGDGLTDGTEIDLGTSPILSDTDGDGLSDGDEVLNQGTDPLSTDSDNDGMPDGWELSFGLDPLVDDSALDPDNDALINVDEFTNGTRPDRPDTDRDRIADGEEVTNGTDPTSNLDFDLDGMSNDWETIRGTSLRRDDARTDADGDGVDNIIEYIRGTLPLDATSVPAINTFFIDSVNGDDASGDGSATAPFATLSTAMSAASTGDTLRLASGNYSPGGVLFFSKMLSIEGPADRSATLSTRSFFIINVNWGGFSNMKLNINGFFNFPSGRNLIFRNMELRLGTSMPMGGNTKLLLDHVLVTSSGATTAIVAGNAPNGMNRTELTLRNTTLAGFQLGIDWNQGQFLRVRDSILDNAVNLQDAQPYQVWNSLTSDGQFTSFGANLGGDPLFVDSANGNYHLLPASPGVDTANPFASARTEPDSVRLNMGFYGGTTEATQVQDIDGDGLPDGWETATGLNSLDPLDRLADNDADGVNNALEYRTGTSPVLSNSRRGVGYWLLNPNQLNSNIEAMSLADGSYISTPRFIRLDQFQTTTIDTVSLGTGRRINSNQAMSLANAANGTDMPVPDWFAGHTFVLPHARNSHRYHLFSPYGDAQVRININGTEQTLSVPRNEVLVFEAGNDNTRSGTVRSDLPLMITHTAYINTQTRDVYAVPPASKQMDGVYSRRAYIGALEDNTQVSVLDSTGVSTQFVLNAGERRAFIAGGASGTGVAMRITADKPISAIQVADRDGLEATAFWDPVYSGRRYGLPIDTQYAAVVCDQASRISLYDAGGVVLDTQNCTPGAAGEPGKAYFGLATNGVNIPAGSYLTGDEAFYMIFEASATNDEKNILGHL